MISARAPMHEQTAGNLFSSLMSGKTVNVGDGERWASTVGGGLLVLLGLSWRSLAGLTLAGVGASLLYRGVSGHCDLYQALGVNTAGHREARPSAGPMAWERR